jgi:sugar lactone lactonase YvrE
MLRAIGSKHRYLWGWLGASSLVLFLVISGCVISPRRLPGDVVPGTTPTPTPSPSATPTPTPGATPAQGKLYVSNSFDNSIFRFDQALTDSGNIPPATTIKGATTKLNQPTYITLDVTADRLFVANTRDLSILIFDNISTKTGDAAPERVIAGANTLLASPTDLSLDKGRDLLYVADDTDVQVFASAATTTGNIAPARTYTTSPAFTIAAIFVDAANDRLYLADSAGQAIDVYDNISSVAAGPITPNRTINGPSTHLGAPEGIAIDGGGRLVVTNGSAHSITIFNNAAGANGDISPNAELVGTNTGFSTPDQIVVDTTGSGTAYSVDPGAQRVAIYSNLSSTTGNVAPTRVIIGPGTGLSTTNQPLGIALDRTR